MVYFVKGRKLVNEIDKKFSVRKMTVIGLLAALTIVMGSLGIGFIPLPGAKATIMHLPVIVGAIIEGPVVGMAIGLIFGLFSIFQNMQQPTWLSPALINPLVSVLPRVCIAITSYYTYRALRGKNTFLAAGTAAAVGTITNTIGVLGMSYILFAMGVVVPTDKTLDAALVMLGTICVTNAIPELVASIIVCVPVIGALLKIYKKK